MTDPYARPADEDALTALVEAARRDGKRLRVRGSGHSVDAAIYTEGFLGRGTPPDGGVDVLLDRLDHVAITPDAAGATVRVGGGCHLGSDPYGPDGPSPWAKSLTFQLEQAGWALPDLGGISHQTVAGFLMTGSAGGTTQYSLPGAIEQIRFVDGTGRAREVGPGDELFEAVGVSMGLLGVVTEVRFRLEPSYAIVGDQTTAGVNDPAAPVDLFADDTDPRGLRSFLRATPYTRLMWWPQRGFERVQVWRAARMGWVPGGKRKPYRELGRAPRLAALSGSLVYTVIGNLDDITRIPDALSDWYAALEGTLDGAPDPNACLPSSAPQPHTPQEVLTWLAQKLVERAPATVEDDHPLARLHDGITNDLDAVLGELEGLTRGGVWERIVRALVGLLAALIERLVDRPWVQAAAKAVQASLPTLMPPILGVFVSDGSQVFYDRWRCGLPMDDQMDDRLWPTEFTELWVPMDRTAEVMGTLRAYYAGDGTPEGAYAATGAFSCEIYAAGKSPFWLSPSWDGDVVRIDVFWFGRNAGSPESFYAPIWDALEPYGFRPHWGKWLPPASPKWSAYYRQRYPKLERFLELRQQLDPDGVFATDYWRAHLGF